MLHRSTLFAALLAATAIAAAQSEPEGRGYTVNGEIPPIAMQQLMLLSGLAPGAYFLEANGDFGPVGQPPIGNVNGGPPVGGQSSAPPPAGAPAAGPASAYPDLVREATGTRIFWVYSPSIFSGATGGASGYVHLCPGGLAYRSSEGALNVGGGHGSQSGRNDDWAGMAQVSSSAGRWTIEPGPQGPMLAVYDAEGAAQRVAVSVARQGSWKFGQTKYAIEPNRASCP